MLVQKYEIMEYQVWFGKLYASAMNQVNSNFALLVILYTDVFIQVDMTALKQMGENDLKELGIPMVINCLSFHVAYIPVFIQ